MWVGYMDSYEVHAWLHLACALSRSIVYQFHCQVIVGKSEAVLVVQMCSHGPLVVQSLRNKLSNAQNVSQAGVGRLSNQSCTNLVKPILPSFSPTVGMTLLELRVLDFTKCRACLITLHHAFFHMYKL